MLKNIERAEIDIFIDDIKRFPSNTELLANTNVALWNLAVPNDKEKVYIYEREGIEQIIESIKSFPNYLDFLAKANTVLGNFACEKGL
jgi:hypothetical protein